MIAVAVIAPHCLEAAPKEEDTYALFRFRPAISKIMSDHIKSVGLALLTRDLSASRAALPPSARHCSARSSEASVLVMRRIVTTGGPF